jgi:hypothetical protein
MRYTRIIALGGLLLAWTPVIGTQVVASQLRYAPWLGHPLLRLGRTGLYAPWQLGVWYWKYAWYYPTPFDWALGVMAGWMVGSALLIAVLLRRAGWRRFHVPDQSTWATAADIRRADLFVKRSK